MAHQAIVNCVQELVEILNSNKIRYENAQVFDSGAGLSIFLDQFQVQTLLTEGEYGFVVNMTVFPKELSQDRLDNILKYCLILQQLNILNGSNTNSNIKYTLAGNKIMAENNVIAPGTISVKMVINGLLELVKNVGSDLESLDSIIYICKDISAVREVLAKTFN